MSTQGFSGGYGNENNYESHSGLTYCAVASLIMLGSEDRICKNRVLEFCILR